MIKTVIIEDEEQNRLRLEKLLSSYCPEVEIIGDARGVRSAYKLIKDLKPDLILLDIQLIDGSGFELLQLFEKIYFKVIFITAYDEYAIKAFRFNALDYLLKPVDPDELVDAIHKALDQFKPSEQLQISNAAQNFAAKEFDKIVLKDIENIYLISISSIKYCKSDGNYTEFHLVNENPIVVSKPIKEFEYHLKNSNFLRIHRSYLINLNHFKRFEKSNGGKVVLAGDIEIPVSSNRRDEIFEFIRRFAK